MTEIFDDIRKIYTFAKPCEPLDAFVEFFSESSSELTRAEIKQADFTVSMFPSWTPTVWINLGAPYRLDTPFGKRIIDTSEDVLLLRDTAVTRNNHISDHIFTIKFFPGGLEAVTGISQPMLKSRIADAADVFPAKFLQALKLQNSFEERKQMTEAYLLNCMQRKGRAADHYLRIVRDSIGLYESGNMNCNTSQVAEKMFVSSKSINRYFSRVVGIAPKPYFSILRARRSLTAYQTHGTAFEPEQFGYYDRSHFYREIRRFTGAVTC